MDVLCINYNAWSSIEFLPQTRHSHLGTSTNSTTSFGHSRVNQLSHSSFDPHSRQPSYKYSVLRVSL
jgi:hypothetical protein